MGDRRGRPGHDDCPSLRSAASGGSVPLPPLNERPCLQRECSVYEDACQNNGHPEMMDRTRHARRWRLPQSPSTGSGASLPSLPLARPWDPLYIERMFRLRLCINQSNHYLHLYRSKYSSNASLIQFTIVILIFQWKPSSPSQYAADRVCATTNLCVRAGAVARDCAANPAVDEMAFRTTSHCKGTNHYPIPSTAPSCPFPPLRQTKQSTKAKHGPHC